MKKILSLLTALIIFVSALSIQGFSAFAEDTAYTGLQENPFYAGREIPDGQLEEYSLPTSVSRTYNNKTYYSDGTAIYKQILTAFQKRSSEITIYYLSKTSLNSISKRTSAIDSLVAAATDDSYNSSPTGGDYQRWSLEYWAAEITENCHNSPYYYYKIKLNLYYFDTAAEETKVNTVVNNFVNSIDTSSMTDYEIIKTVHDFICNNASYCDDAVYDYSSHEYAFSAYGALVKGSCVCQGYSLAF
jgi:transglutaminase/protease-like cytokinesis protein 3